MALRPTNGRSVLVSRSAGSCRDQEAPSKNLICMFVESSERQPSYDLVNIFRGKFWPFPSADMKSYSALIFPKRCAVANDHGKPGKWESGDGKGFNGLTARVRPLSPRLDNAASLALESFKSGMANNCSKNDYTCTFWCLIAKRPYLWDELAPRKIPEGITHRHQNPYRSTSKYMTHRGRGTTKSIRLPVMYYILSS